MAKFVLDAVLDALLLEVVNNGNLMTVCSAQPTTRNEAVVTFALADVALTVGDGLGDYTISNGDVSGRKANVAAQANVPVDTSGTGNHVAIVDATRLLLVTTTASAVALTSGGTVTISTFDLEVADAA